ncbi:MAG: NfeD family protein [Candidatus Cloacimonetes bacterium]|jgi:membrane protein implicated in regulation of membrane protease activity|nr:NfeD family protein [Candidatus Cloacimonadota bacterium]MDD3563565.1 NfeD family protein [Candidatus Cloacimonadota bacterium]MDD4277334.1 NfeD family protein [Candidatus Cloacimonadota bacterium]MDY0326083.1 NfeD family protein [Candidatus Cloacimonadaceae bacterium]
MALLAWHIWLILGIIFVIIEIFDPAFFFLSLGIGAIVTGLLALLPFVQSNLWLQIFSFAIISFLGFLSMRRLSKKVLANPGPETNVFALKGQLAFVTQAIPADGRGYVKVGGEEWVAITEDHSALAEGIKVEILDIDGNKLIVKETNQ